MPANLENSAVAKGQEKVSFHFNSKERQCQKNVHTTTQPHSSHTIKVVLKIVQARLQQYMNCEFADVHGGFTKAEEPEIKLPRAVGSSKKQESSRKTSPPVLLLCQSLWLCGSEQTVEIS